MKSSYTQKRKTFVYFCTILLFSLNAISQVGIGTTDPNANALLDIDATTVPGGLLLPRLELTGTSDVTPLTAHVQGMTVYNTATAGSGNTAVSPGFYYNDGTQWIRLASGPQADNNWSLTGNAGTNPTNNFLGTTTDQALRIRTNNADRFEFSTGGTLKSFANGTEKAPTYSWNSNVGTGMFQQRANVLGFSTDATERFRIPNAFQVHAMNNGSASYPFYSWASNSRMGMFGAGHNILAFSTNANESMRILADRRIAVNRTTAIVDTRLTVGETGANRAIFGNSGGGEGIRGESNSDSGVVGISNSGPGVYGTASHADGYGGVFYNAITNGIGMMASGNNGPAYYIPNSGSGAGITGRYYASTHLATDNNGTGLAAAGNNITTFRVHPQGGGIAGTGKYYGVYGYADIGLRDDGFGGYFISEYNGLAAVGGWIGNTQYKIIGNGSVSTIVEDINENPVVMFAPEAPEILLQDYGVGKLRNGSAYIHIDPNLSKNLRVDPNYPLKVFIQLEGDCKGVYVTDKTAKGFLVKELQGGNSNVSFAWQIVGTRANSQIRDNHGNSRVSDNSVRFPKLPESFVNSGVKISHAKEKNKLSKESVSIEESIGE